MKLLFPFIAGLFLISCADPISIRENSPEDIEEAIGYAKGFYEVSKDNDTLALKKFLGKPLSLEKFQELTLKINNLLGEFIAISENANVFTKVTNKGKMTNKFYQISIDVTYSKGKASELLIMETINDTLKLTSYNLTMKFN